MSVAGLIVLTTTWSLFAHAQPPPSPQDVTGVRTTQDDRGGCTLHWVSGLVVARCNLIAPEGGHVYRLDWLRSVESAPSEDPMLPTTACGDGSAVAYASALFARSEQAHGESSRHPVGSRDERTITDDSTAWFCASSSTESRRITCVGTWPLSVWEQCVGGGPQPYHPYLGAELRLAGNLRYLLAYPTHVSIAPGWEPFSASANVSHVIIPSDWTIQVFAAPKTHSTTQVTVFDPTLRTRSSSRRSLPTTTAGTTKKTRTHLRSAHELQDLDDDVLQISFSVIATRGSRCGSPLVTRLPRLPEGFSSRMGRASDPTLQARISAPDANTTRVDHHQIVWLWRCPGSGARSVDGFDEPEPIEVILSAERRVTSATDAPRMLDAPVFVDSRHLQWHDKWASSSPARLHVGVVRPVGPEDDHKNEEDTTGSPPMPIDDKGGDPIGAYLGVFVVGLNVTRASVVDANGVVVWATEIRAIDQGDDSAVEASTGGVYYRWRTQEIGATVDLNIPTMASARGTYGLILQIESHVTDRDGNVQAAIATTRTVGFSQPGCESNQAYDPNLRVCSTIPFVIWRQAWFYVAWGGLVVLILAIIRIKEARRGLVAARMPLRISPAST